MCGTTPNPATPPNNGAGQTGGTIATDPGLVHDTDTESELETGSVHTSSTASLSESINEYRRLHGRTYTQKVEYWGPNDEKQNGGLDINHWWMTLFLGDKLSLAPIGKSPQKVLDVGTGTGIWAIDFADEFPTAEVTGVDVSPIQPSWVPPNCKFQIDDVEQPWTWPAEHFDFIHVRNLEGAIADWDKLYEQAFMCTKPGGYIEIKEFDIATRSQVQELKDDHPLKLFPKYLLEGAEKIGKVGLQCRDNGIAKSLRAAGFTDVVEQRLVVPVGSWPSDPVLKEVGIGSSEYLDQSLEGFSTFLLKEILGWEYAEVLVFVSQVRKAMKDLSLQNVFDLHVVYARKPEDTPEEA